MTKISILAFSLLITTWVNAQVGINTETPEATLHVDGNVRIQTPKKVTNTDYLNGIKSIEDEYKPLYWDKDTHEIVTREMEHPYIEGKVEYTDGATAIELNLDPNVYQLFVTEVSIKKPQTVNSNYTIVVKNTNNKGMPIKTFELGKSASGNKYTFKAFFQNAGGNGLYYYDGSTTITPAIGQKPIWVANFIAVDKNYLSKFYELQVDYDTYWDCPTCGGKYGIELGKYFEQANPPTSVQSKENTEL